MPIPATQNAEEESAFDGGIETPSKVAGAGAVVGRWRPEESAPIPKISTSTAITTTQRRSTEYAREIRGRSSPSGAAGCSFTLI